MFYILLVMTAFAAQTSLAEIHACDKCLVAKIIKYWNGNPPTHLIETAIANGKEVVVGTTKDYYPDNVAGTFSYFVQEKYNPLTRVDIYEVDNKGILISKKIYVREEYGTTYDPHPKVRRYHLYQNAEGGVTAFYACSEAYNATRGFPAGILKVRAFNYNKYSVAKAITVLKRFGVYIVEALSASIDK